MNSEVYLFKNLEQHFSQIAVLHCRNSRSHTGMMYQSENAKQNGDEAVHSNKAEVELIKLLALWPALLPVQWMQFLQTHFSLQSDLSATLSNFWARSYAFF